MDSIYKQSFPNLSDVINKKTSEATSVYNCIAWAFGDDSRVWWPHPKAFWPLPLGGMTAMAAFDAWFNHDGWKETKNAEVESDFEKIALFTNSKNEPTHAARLLPSGLWTSKLGWHPNFSIDLSHALTDLDGPSYGSATKIYRKQRPSSASV